MKGRKDINPNYFSNVKSESNSSIITLDAKFPRQSMEKSTPKSNSRLNLPTHMRQARASGHLNVSNSNLNELPMDICNYYTLPIDPSENFWEVFPLTKLDFSYNNIAILPNEISLLTDLTSLKLRNNIIKDLPDGIKECKAITILDCTGNQISRVGDYVQELRELRELLCSGNQISSVHPGINSCQSIHTLELYNNRLKSLPDLYGFPFLHQLNLSGNLLEWLPESIASITTIKTLDLKKNRLRRLPDLTGMKALTILDVSENLVEEFPILPLDGILSRLHLSNNNLSTISIPFLLRVRNSLSELHLNDNKISMLPNEIGYLSQLVVLQVVNNNLSDLPVSIGYISSLSKVLVDGNSIRSIRRTLLTVQATNELKAYLRTRGSSLDGQMIEDNRVNLIDKNRSSKIHTTSTVENPQVMSTNHPVERIFEEKIRNMVSGYLDLSKQERLLSMNRDWSIVLYHLLEKYTNRESESERPSPSMVKSIADLGGINTTSTSISSLASSSTISFSALKLSKLDLSYNRITNIWLPYENHPNSMSILCSGNNNEPAILSQLIWLNLSNNHIGSELTVTEDRVLTMNRTYGMNIQLLPVTLVYLNMNQNKLDDSHATLLLKGLSNLQELHMVGNMLQSIPIDRPSQLRVLRLANNRIQSIDDFDILFYPKLETLDLCDNRIERLEGLIEGMLSSIMKPTSSISDHSNSYNNSMLSSLLLSNNQIKEIPSELCLLPKLSKLTLHGNPQKMIRSHHLDNTSAILLSLRNKLSPEILSMTLSSVSESKSSNKLDSRMEYKRDHTNKESSEMLEEQRGQSKVTSFRQLEKDIEDIERQLDESNVGTSMTIERRTQLQKTLTLKRANYNRLKG